MENENWKQVPGYEGYYEASDLGRIRSVDRYGPHGKGMGHKKGRVLKASVHNSGYCQVGLCMLSKHRNHLVHCLVAAAFIGPRPEGLEVCHEDGDRENCRLDNLRYDTKKNNAADKVGHGTANQGDTNPRANLTAEQVMGIYERCSAGEAQTKLAEELGVNVITVNHIATGKTWSSVTGAKWSRVHALITPKIVKRIAELQAAGSTLDQIAIELGISKPSAFRHSKGKSKVIEGSLCVH